MITWRLTKIALAVCLAILLTQGTPSPRAVIPASEPRWLSPDGLELLTFTEGDALDPPAVRCWNTRTGQHVVRSR